jgi:putative nucleotidyltransferase with HDIG domain
VQAALLRVVAVAIPVAAGVGASVLFSRVVTYPHGLFPIVCWWIAVLSISALVVALVERQCRRLLPLATLLKLSMVFPDKAPSRFGVALRAGTVKNLEERVAEVRAHGVDSEPARAATQILELVGAMGVHDRATRGHAERVRAYADLLGAELDLSEDDRDRLRWAALLHDVGKVAMPKEIINKPGKLDAEEWAIMKTHTIEGQRMLDRVGGFMGEVGLIVRSHHERWDGAGYPDGLAGDAIPLESRIIACCDTWNAMTTTRSYRPAMAAAAAAAELERVAGTQLDPRLVEIVLERVASSAVEPVPAPEPALVSATV